jgi:hypothetical protein
MLPVGIHHQNVSEAFGMSSPQCRQHGSAFSGVLRQAQKPHALQSKSLGLGVTAIRAGIHHDPHIPALGTALQKGLSQAGAAVEGRQ